ncbi:MAG: HNH endonuclease signature motif containing protein [Chloroflexota bacterium]|nr:HNH endonuclease signature motif containing protein [Chloroflexota bacterium]
MATWRDAVIDGIRRLTRSKDSYVFSRQELINQQLEQITKEIQSKGETPSQTLSRILQELREEGIVDFVDNNGNYAFLLDEIRIEREDLPVNILDRAIQNQKLNFANIATGENKIQARQRIGQERLRYWTLINYQSQCALCDVSTPQLLITSHLARWADCPEGRGDLSNIVCLCRWHDPLLEYGLISFTDTYKIIKKNPESKMLIKILHETKTLRQPIQMPLSPEYLAKHRERTGFSS